MKFTATCSCGDVMSVDAANRDEAVMKFKEMMNADAIRQHFADKHTGQQVPDVASAHAMLVSSVRQV